MATFEDVQKPNIKQPTRSAIAHSLARKHIRFRRYVDWFYCSKLDCAAGYCRVSNRSALAVIDKLIYYSPRTQALRQPTTTDESSYWYISTERWNGLLADVLGDEKAKSKVALNNLRKFDAAGRIMETNEGVAAVEACSWCARDSTTVCTIYADSSKGAACAYCRRHAKSGCSAKAIASPPTTEERVAQVESQLAEAQETIRAQQETIEQQQTAIERFEFFQHASAEEYIKFGQDLERLWAAVFQDGN